MTATASTGGSGATAERWLATGRAMLQAGRGADACAALVEAIVAAPASDAAREALVLLRDVPGRDRTALDAAVLEGLRRVDDKVAFLARYGDYFLLDQRCYEAEGAYERALAIHEQSADAWRGLGVAQRHLGRLDQALQAGLRAVEIDPGFVAGYEDLGDTLLARGDRKAAEDAFIRALSVDPRAPGARLGVGLLLEGQGAFADAEACARTVLSRRPQDTDAQLLLARALHAQQRIDEARAAYREAAALGGGALAVLQGLLAMPEGGGDDAGAALDQFLAADIRAESEAALVRGGLSPIRAAHLRGLPASVRRKVAQAYLKLCPWLAFAASHAVGRRNAAADGAPIRIVLVGRFTEPQASSAALTRLLDGLVALDGVRVTLVSVGLSNQVGTVAELAGRCEQALSVRYDTLGGVQRTIAGLGADILIYPELAADAFLYFLAFARLARLQCVLGGLGGDGGLPNLDLLLRGPQSTDLDDGSPVAAAGDGLPVLDWTGLPPRMLLDELKRRALAASPALPEQYLPLLPLATACARQGGEYRELAPAQYLPVHEPEMIGAGEAAPASGMVRLPPVAAGVLSDVVVQGGESAVLLREPRGIVHVLGEHASPRRAMLETGWLLSRVGDEVLLCTGQPLSRAERAIVLLGEGSANYYHWMLDNLPRLQAILDDPRFADWPVLIERGLHRNLIDALRKLVGNQRTLLEIDGGSQVQLAQAVVLSGGTTIPLDPQDGVRFKPEDVAVSPQAVAFLRERLGCPERPAGGGRRLYLARGGRYRRLLNADEVERFFVDCGFEVVHPEALDLPAQMALFSEAEIVAGPTGAAFANIAFMPQGSKAIVLYYDVGLHYYFSNLAEASGVRLLYVFGEPQDVQHVKPHQSDYAVPLGRLDTAVRAFGLGPRPASQKAPASVTELPPLGFVIHLPELINHYAEVWKHLPGDSFEVALAGEDADRRLIAQQVVQMGYAVRDSAEILRSGRRYRHLVSNHPIDLSAPPLIKQLGERNVRFMYGLGKSNWNFADWNALYDAVLCFGPFQVAGLERFEKVRKLQMGYPRFDGFFRNDWDLAGLAAQYRCDPARPTVVWLPTWKELSSVPHFLSAVAALRPHYNVVVKLHPLQSRDEPALVRLVEQAGLNSVIADSRDNVPLFRLADYVLCDYGGSVFGALYTGRKVVLLDVPGAENDALLGAASPEVELRRVLPHLGPEEGGQLADLLADEALWAAQAGVRPALIDLFVAPFKGFAGKVAALYLQNMEAILDD